NGVVIESNEVSANGGLVSGSSGIHVYGGVGSGDGFGVGNVIANNTVFGNREASHGFDGNGIQLDQFTSNNQVKQNVVHDNDGAGILIYDSSSNQIISNTLSGDSLDLTNSHPYRGEIILASDLHDTDNFNFNNLVSGNNITLSTAAVKAFVID